MKKLSYFFGVICLLSCTSNTIFEKPKDLIPKDTMTLLIQDLIVASSSKFIKNKNFEKNINYMPFVYKKYKIDSLRFQTSNLYYMSTIDEYIKVFENAKANLESQKSILDSLKTKLDSIRKDSIEKRKELIKKKMEKDTSLYKIDTKLSPKL